MLKRFGSTNVVILDRKLHDQWRSGCSLTHGVTWAQKNRRLHFECERRLSIPDGLVARFGKCQKIRYCLRFLGFRFGFADPWQERTPFRRANLLSNVGRRVLQALGGLADPVLGIRHQPRWHQRLGFSEEGFGAVVDLCESGWFGLVLGFC